VIHALGFSWYAVWTAALGEPVRFLTALSQSVIPFVGVDVVKAVLAGGVAMGVRGSRE
jgi:hypothetical protein